MLTVDMLIDFNTGSIGDVLNDTTNMTTGTQGTNSGFLVSPAPPTGFTLQAHQLNLLDSVQVRGGSLYLPTHVSKSFSLDNTHNFTYAQWWVNGPPTQAVVTVAGWLHLGPANIGVSGHLYDMVQSVGPGGDEFTFQLNNGNAPGTTYGVNIESIIGAATTHSAYITVVPATTYWVSFRCNYTTNKADVALYDTGGGFVGQILNVSKDSNSATIDAFRFGNNEVGADAGTTWFENWLIDYTGVFPLGPGVVSSPGLFHTRPFPFRPGGARHRQWSFNRQTRLYEPGYQYT